MRAVFDNLGTVFDNMFHFTMILSLLLYNVLFYELVLKPRDVGSQQGTDKYFVVEMNTKNGSPLSDLLHSTMILFINSLHCALL